LITMRMRSMASIGTTPAPQTSTSPTRRSAKRWSPSPRMAPTRSMCCTSMAA
jgi:hypothetical protein